MARKVNMITRTIEETTVAVMGLNTSTKEVVNEEIIIAGKINPDRLLKFMNDNFAPADTVFVQASILKVSETLYGMPDTEFVKHAKKLPPR